MYNDDNELLDLSPELLDRVQGQDVKSAQLTCGPIDHVGSAGDSRCRDREGAPISEGWMPQREVWVL